MVIDRWHLYGCIRASTWIVELSTAQIYYDSGMFFHGRRSGGVLLNQCPHNLDLLQWICGMPARVQAFCNEGKWHDIEVEDEVTAYLEYPNGATGVL